MGLLLSGAGIETLTSNNSNPFQYGEVWACSSAERALRQIRMTVLIRFWVGVGLLLSGAGIETPMLILLNNGPSEVWACSLAERALRLLDHFF